MIYPNRPTQNSLLLYKFIFPFPKRSRQYRTNTIHLSVFSKQIQAIRNQHTMDIEPSANISAIFARFQKTRDTRIRLLIDVSMRPLIISANRFDEANVPICTSTYLQRATWTLHMSLLFLLPPLLLLRHRNRKKKKRDPSNDRNEKGG